MTGRALLASFVLAALAGQAFVVVVESRASPTEKASQGDNILFPYAVCLCATTTTNNADEGGEPALISVVASPHACRRRREEAVSGPSRQRS